MNPSYFFVSNQPYNLVDSSDPIFGNQKNYRTEHILEELTFQIRTSDREAVSILNGTSKGRIKNRFKEPVWSFSKFSRASTPWKRKKLQKTHRLLFQQPKKLPAKSFKKEAYFCAIRLYDVLQQKNIHLLIHRMKCPKIDFSRKWTIAALLIFQTNWFSIFQRFEDLSKLSLKVSQL